MRLRRADVADLDWLAGLERRDDYGRFIGRWPLDEHRRNLADPDFVYWIAEDETGAPIGFAILNGAQSADGEMELFRTAVVDPGRGFGRAMLRDVVTHAFDRFGAQRVKLDVYDDNPRARRVYERLGFRFDGTTPGQPRADGTPTTLVLMSIARDG